MTTPAERAGGVAVLGLERDAMRQIMSGGELCRNACTGTVFSKEKAPGCPGAPVIGPQGGAGRFNSSSSQFCGRGNGLAGLELEYSGDRVDGGGDAHRALDGLARHFVLAQLLLVRSHAQPAAVDRG